MKHCALFLIFSLTLLSALLIPLAFACLNSYDDYAAEVILSKENISTDFGKLRSARYAVKSFDSYILQSQINSAVASIITQTSDGMSVRIQLPTKAIVRDLSFLELEADARPAEDLPSCWSCDGNYCLREIDNIKASLTKLEGKSHVLLEIYEEIGDCNRCSGRCVVVSQQRVCIKKETLGVINSVFSEFGQNFESFFSTSEKRITLKHIEDLQSEINTLDFGEALKQELVFLDSKGVASIPKSDIDAIAAIAKQGTAGNKRIIYALDKTGEKKWMLYSGCLNAVTKEKVCREFSQSLIPTGYVVFSSMPNISYYYAVPIILVVLVVVLFLILLGVSRFVKHENLASSQVQAV